MKCDKCDKEAVIEINILSEEGSAKIALCESCYQDYIEQFDQPLMKDGTGEEDFKFFQQILSELVSSMLVPEETKEKILDRHSEELGEKRDEKACSRCGTSFSWILKNGKFGCDHCYEEFRTSIDQILLQTQGTNDHKGKIPERYEGLRSIKKEIREKEDELKEMVYEEKYEEAASLRDKLKELKNELLEVSDQIDER
ncbi:MAG: UvrB/UvrC motif-containing protein [Gallicola sp.]|nr:UvrB/UvrC motif-containing protein [Gallicola sp.]